MKEPEIWYAKARVGLKQVAKCLNEMVTALPGVEGANYSNKSARVTTIGHFNAMGVPPEISMRMTRHTSKEGYMRYDKDSQDIMMRALQNVMSVVPGTDGDISWKAALNYEKDHYKELLQKSASKSYIASSSNNHILPSLLVEMSFNPSFLMWHLLPHEKLKEFLHRLHLLIELYFSMVINACLF